MLAPLALIGLRLQKRKPGWLARLLSAAGDAVTSLDDAADGEVRLVWLWPVSVARKALPRVSKNWRRGALPLLWCNRRTIGWI